MQEVPHLAPIAARGVFAWMRRYGSSSLRVPRVPFHRNRCDRAQRTKNEPLLCARQDRRTCRPIGTGLFETATLSVSPLGRPGTSCDGTRKRCLPLSPERCLETPSRALSSSPCRLRTDAGEVGLCHDAAYICMHRARWRCVNNLVGSGYKVECFDPLSRRSDPSDFARHPRMNTRRFGHRWSGPSP